MVNDELAGRTGEDFYLAVPVSGMKENVLKIQAARANPDQVATDTRSVLVPAVPEQFEYDLDGNLTQDGLWNYEWDGENRLKAQELRPEVITNTWKRIENVYDSQSRRIQKVVKTRSSPTAEWVILSDTRYLYDGWNLIAEYSFASGTFTALRSHAWGLDLSGTPQGAGGVGGLLWTKDNSTAKTYAAGADANGNVVVYVDCSNGSVAGRRDYGPFGEAVVTTGIAGSLPFGFSTKFEEKESGYYYYGFRYYNPSTGKWPNRDPIEERGGVNLYGMVGNNPVNLIDPLGLEVEISHRVFNISGGAGLGGSLSGTLRVTAKDCCKDGVKIVNGDKKLSATIRGGLGVGFGANFNVGGFGLGASLNLNFANIELSGVAQSPSCGEEPGHLRLSGSFAASPVNHTYAGTFGIISGNFSVIAQAGITISADITQYAVNYRGELNGTAGISGTYSLLWRPTVNYVNQTTGFNREIFNGTIRF